MHGELMILIKCYSDFSCLYGIYFNFSYLAGVGVFSPLWNTRNAEIKYCKYVRLTFKSKRLSIQSSIVQLARYPMSNSSLQQMLRKHQTRNLQCTFHKVSFHPSESCSSVPGLAIGSSLCLAAFAYVITLFQCLNLNEHKNPMAN